MTKPQEVIRLMLCLGLTAFGGPAAHIAMLRQEVVIKRAWVTEQQFLDYLGIVNLIPGPNSTELVMHVSMQRAGWRGLWLGGTAFILPAASITLLFAWLYQQYGTTPIGTGIINAKRILNDHNLNLLGLNRDHKFFGIFSFNNIGINRSIKDFFANNRTTTQRAD